MVSKNSVHREKFVPLNKGFKNYPNQSSQQGKYIVSNNHKYIEQENHTYNHRFIK
jgi:hypothetical protein